MKSSVLDLTRSEFSAGLWAKREGSEQSSVLDLEALGRSLEAIEPFASPLAFEQGTPIEVFL